MQATRSHRGLSTARAALSVTWLLARAPDGVRADEVAETLGKSVSTAYNLLAACATRASPSASPAACTSSRTSSARPSPRSPTATTSAAWSTTCSRARTSAPTWPCCAATTLRVVLERGLQGMPKLPGHEPGDPRQRARAGARQGRARARPRRRARALRSAPASSASRRDTITDPTRCARSCGASGCTGVATEREEIAPDFCCIAAPVLDHERRFLGAVGISMSRARLRHRARAPRGDAARRRRIPTHLRMSAQFLIAVRTAVLASSEHRGGRRAASKEAALSRASITKAHQKIQELSWEPDVRGAGRQVPDRLHVREGTQEGPAQAGPALLLPDGGGEGQPRLRRDGRRDPRQHVPPGPAALDGVAEAVPVASSRSRRSPPPAPCRWPSTRCRTPRSTTGSRSR